MLPPTVGEALVVSRYWLTDGYGAILVTNASPPVPRFGGLVRRLSGEVGGIRGTGDVSCTCAISGDALPEILRAAPQVRGVDQLAAIGRKLGHKSGVAIFIGRLDGRLRSEERRVGKECRSRW